MLLNIEQDNSGEGNYFKAIKIDPKDSTLLFNMPFDFYLNSSNISKWHVGWGKQQPYFDAGNENLRSIERIDIRRGEIQLGKIQRGEGFPQKGQRIVFWNSAPSGFTNEIKRPIISTDKWLAFNKKSIAFSSIEYDSVLAKWVMLFHECDNPVVQIYAALSKNLIDWNPGNDGKPILTPCDFQHCNWVVKSKDGKNLRTPYISDILYENKKWYIFFDCFDNYEKRHIGLGVSEKNSLGPYKLFPNPILSPGKAGTWNDKAVFYPKVKKYKDGFILFYDGQNQSEHERVGMAFSKNLLEWYSSIYNPVLDQHQGWRMAITSSEPNSVIIQHDSIFLMTSGTKNSTALPVNTHNSIWNGMGISGNVNDAELGVFLSTNGGKNFQAHINNPIFVNDYSNVNENDHMGGNFKLIKTDTADFIIYQAKSEYKGNQYNILERIKRK
jgi:hypothetical protein